MALAERKRRKGKDVVEVPEAAREEEGGAEIIDLMEVLKRSLGAHATRRSPARGTTARRAPAKSTAKAGAARRRTSSPRAKPRITRSRSR